VRRRPRRASAPSDGPYTGRDAARALERDGWVLEHQPADDEVWIYVHPLKEGRSLVNPDWPAIYKNDDIFRVLRDDMSVSTRRLLELLSDHV
jgi:hypothetical protein